VDETQVLLSASASHLPSPECRCPAEWLCADPNLFHEFRRAADAAAIEGRRAAARRGVSVAGRAKGARLRPPAAWTG
jgi:hypothetical protein